MLNSPRLVQLAEAVADGRYPDWAAAESSAENDAERLLIRRLHAASRIGFARAMLYTSSLTSATLGPRADLASGATWGTLRVLEKVGRGHFGDVYRAWDPALDREVALKILRRPHGAPAGNAAQVVGEGRLMARVRHPNVATIYGAQTIDGVTGLWMEFIRGRTLAAELADRGPFTTEELTRVGIELCGALAAVHAAGLVHRDVKAQNVLLENSGRVVLGDFGTGLEYNQSDASELAGTPSYLAPEVFQRQPATPASDLYSLGALLFHLATQAFPVVGRSVREIKAAHVTGRRTTLASARPGLPAALTAAIDRALDPNPARRFRDAAGMAEALERAAAMAPAVSRVLPRRFGIAAAGLLLACAVLATPILSPRTAISRTEREPILITAFENRTGEPLLDGTLEQVFERELASSPLVTVVSRDRAEDALRLMQKPLDTRIDATSGREVALRDGQIRMVVAGSIDRIGDRYLLGARMIRVDDGSIVAAVSEEAGTPSDLLRGMREASLKMRRLFGETLQTMQDSGAALAKVTTPSLRALSLYSQALDLARPNRTEAERAASARLLREAIAEDPEFASALILVARHTHFEGNPEAAREIARRALDAAAHATEHERLFISGGVDELLAAGSSNAAERLHHLRQAVAAFEALLRLQPTHDAALQSLGSVYNDLGEFSQAAWAWARRADARPNSSAVQQQAAMAMLRSGDIVAAGRFAERARRVAPAVPHATEAFHVVWAKLFPAHEAWLANDARTALQLTDAAVAEMQTWPHNTGYASIVDMYLALGRIDQAAAALQWDPNDPLGTLAKAIVTAERDDVNSLRASLAPLIRDFERHRSERWLGLPRPWRLEAAYLLIDAGRADIARALTAKVEGPERAALDGELALSRRRIEIAIQQLEEAHAMLMPGISRWQRAALKLAEAWVAKGDRAQGIAVLESAGRQPRLEMGMATHWMRLRMRLADLYRATGRVEAARGVEGELQSLLALADDDHPIKRRLLASVATTRDIGVSVKQVWTGDHILVALPSPDGRLLPLLERGRFVLRDLLTGADRLVTQESGYPTGVAVFTPDGRRLVYGWREAGSDDFLLKTVDVDGRNDRLLHRTRFDNGAQRPVLMAIAPDGLTAAVVTSEGSRRSIGLMNLESGAMEVLHRFEWEFPLVGNFSPDGRYLAYSVLATRGDSQQRELRLTEIRTRQVSTLGVPAGQHFNPRFSPDGTHIVFPSGPPDARRLAALRFDGSNARGPVEVVFRDVGPGSGLFPGSGLGFTQTGAYYFLRTSTAEDAFSVPVDPATGQVLGAPERVSERFAGRTSGLIWSPDGQRLAYIARHERPTTPRGVMVVVRSLVTGAEREFRVPFNNFAAAGYHRWFPDGRSILLVDAVDGRRVFRQLDVETGEVRPLFETALGASSSPYRTWIEPDGRAIYYNATVASPQPNSPSSRELRWVRRDLTTGEERTVATLNATSVNPSPDGRYLSVLEKNAGPGAVFSFADGSLSQAWTPKNAAFEGGGMGWAPDSRGMYFALAPRGESEVIVNPEQERLEIWYYSLESGSARRSGLTMPAMNQLFVRGDGARLGFTGRVTTGSLWRIDGLFPPPAGTASDRER